MSKKDYYEILSELSSVNKNSSPDEIKSQYKKLAIKYHPDRNPGNKEAEAKFKEINEAYSIVGDAQKKATYDQYGSSAFENGGGGGYGQGGFNPFGGFGGVDLNDILNQAFGGGFNPFGGGRQQQKRRSNAVNGEDLRYDVTITLEEAFTGITKNISFVAPCTCENCNGTGADTNSKTDTCPNCHGSGYSRQQRGMFIMEGECPKCHGTGQIIKNPCSVCNGNGKVEKKRELQVKIPAGISDGQRIRINGEGETGIKGGVNGDLYVFVKVQSAENWVRDGDNLLCNISVLLTTAVLGGEVKITLIDDTETILKIPAGIESGTKLKIRDKGMSVLNSGGRRGDVVATIKVEIPTADTNEEKELYSKLDSILKEKSTNNNGFFNKWFK
ncbi:MAG: molecular chaperone DnaJ [Rickettsiales bacterium]|nr:MAG: molecular chaperone DnaJ [Rickettsiales bacterium]